MRSFAVALAVVCIGRAVAAQTSDIPNLKGVHTVVLQLIIPPTVADSGLDSVAFRTHSEFQMRRSGLVVVADTSPHFDAVIVIEIVGFRLFSAPNETAPWPLDITLDVMQLAQLVRLKNRVVLLSTYHRSRLGVGYTTPDVGGMVTSVNKKVDPLLEAFLNDWLSANPPSPSR